MIKMGKMYSEIMRSMEKKRTRSSNQNQPLEKKIINMKRLLILYFLFVGRYNDLFWYKWKNTYLFHYGKNQYLSRGYYGPSPIIDFITVNMKREGFYQRKPGRMNSIMEYGYSEKGALSVVRKFDSFGINEQTETLFYVGKYILGLLWRKFNLIEISIQEYEPDGKIGNLSQVFIKSSGSEDQPFSLFECEQYIYSIIGQIDVCERFRYHLDNDFTFQLPAFYERIDFKGTSDFIKEFCITRQSTIESEKRWEYLDEKNVALSSVKNQRWYRPDYYYDQKNIENR